MRSAKPSPSQAIRAAYACGLREFGESYLQEALAKIAALQDLPLVWHFIGPIQSNKTRAIAEHFDWVHSVDRVKIAQRLSDQRPAGWPRCRYLPAGQHLRRGEQVGRHPGGAARSWCGRCLHAAAACSCAA